MIYWQPRLSVLWSLNRATSTDTPPRAALLELFVGSRYFAVQAMQSILAVHSLWLVMWQRSGNPWQVFWIFSVQASVSRCGTELVLYFEILYRQEHHGIEKLVATRVCKLLIIYYSQFKFPLAYFSTVCYVYIWLCAEVNAALMFDSFLLSLTGAEPVKAVQVKKEGLSSEERRLARFMPSIFQEVRVPYFAGGSTARAAFQTTISVATRSCTHVWSADMDYFANTAHIFTDWYYL